MRLEGVPHLVTDVVYKASSDIEGTPAIESAAVYLRPLSKEEEAAMSVRLKLITPETAESATTPPAPATTEE